MSAKAILSASVSAAPVYVEDVFSTFLYTGNGSTQTITNGIDLSGKGGLVWAKCRTDTISHTLQDTARGTGVILLSNLTNGNVSSASYIQSFNSNGWTTAGGTNINASNQTYASWTFRKAPKFFDVVTWTGDGTDNRLISHNLGSRPGAIIAKKTSGTSHWPVWHRSLTGGGTYSTDQNAYLNLTLAAGTEQCFSSNGNTDVTSTTFPVSALVGSESLNQNGATYVAYLFAHDAGGFGTAGTDNVVSCGTFTTDGVGKQTVDLGWEPQWILVKSSNNTGDWQIIDNMRGWPMFSENTTVLRANLSSAETTNSTVGNPTATGFIFYGPLNNAPYIYIAIRRGPMKTPTVGTQVFSTILQSPQSAGTVRTVGFPADLVIGNLRSSNAGHYFQDRLRGFPLAGTTQNTLSVQSQSTAAETSQYPYFYDVWNTTAKDGDLEFMSNGAGWTFRRAPGFFDVVAYTGTGSTRTVAHNLGVVPELMIVKNRSQSQQWVVYIAPTSTLVLNSTAAFSTYPFWNTAPTSSVFTVRSNEAETNGSGTNYIAYLFASCPGVSKVGSYTGNGTTQTINCDFTSGARFVLIKRTDETGGWYVYDTARGMTVLTDPYLLLNTTDAEVATLGSVTTVSTGFALNSTILADINISAGTYIFLAIS